MRTSPPTAYSGAHLHDDRGVGVSGAGAAHEAEADGPGELAELRIRVVGVPET